MSDDQIQALDNPYVGPRSFKTEQAHLFFGREQEARDLSNLVIAQRLVLFYAESGAGKTSLINTKLKPNLEQANFEVLPVGRISGSARPAKDIANIFVYNLILSLVPKSSDINQFKQMSLADFLNFSSYQSLNDHTLFIYDEDYVPDDILPRTLIIDQVEEIITAYPEAWSQRHAFFEQVRQAMDDDPYLGVVFSLREDYVTNLDPYADIFQERFRYRYRLRRMGTTAAKDAIGLPVAETDYPFAEETINSLVEELSKIRVQSFDKENKEESVPGSSVEPVQLQVVCQQIWQYLQGSPPREITLDDLETLIDEDPDDDDEKTLADFITNALGNFYESTLQQVLRKHKGLISQIELRAWFERALITEARTRDSVHQGETQTAGLDNTVVQSLASDFFLLRQESRAGSTWYELTHDRFVEPILQANQTWREDQALWQFNQTWRKGGCQENFLLGPNQLKVYLKPGWEHLGPEVEEFVTASQERVEAKAQEQRKTEEQWTQERLVAAQRLAEAERARADEAKKSARHSQALAEEQSKRAETERAKRKAAIFFSIVMFLTIIVVALGALNYNQLLQEEAIRNATATKEAQAVDAKTTAISIAATAEAIAQEATTQAQAQALETTIVTEATAQAFETAIAIQATAQAFETEIAVRETAQAEAAQESNVLAQEALDKVKQGQYDQAIALTKWGFAHLEDFNQANLIPTYTQRIPPYTHTTKMEEALYTVLLKNHFEDVDVHHPTVTLEAHQATVYDVFFSPEGRFAFSTSADGILKQWDTTTWQVVESLPIRPDTQPGYSVAFNNLGQMAVLTTETSIYLSDLADLETGEILGSYEDTSNDFVWAIALSSQGEYLVTVGEKGRSEGQVEGWVNVWNLETGAQSAWQAHNDLISGLAFSPKGDYVATASKDATAAVWAIPTGTKVLTLTEHIDWINKVLYTPDGQHLMTAADDGRVIVWSAETGEVLQNLDTGQPYVHSISLNQAGTRLVALNSNGMITQWQKDEDTKLWQVPLQFYSDHKGTAWNIALNPVGDTFLTGSVDTSLKLWAFDDALALYQVFRSAFADEITHLAVASDTQRIAGVSPTGQVEIWDSESLTSQGLITLAEKIWPPETQAQGIAFHGDSLTLALSKTDVLELWQIPLTEVHPQFPSTPLFPRPYTSPVAVALSPAGQYWAYSTQQGQIVIETLPEGQKFIPFQSNLWIL